MLKLLLSFNADKNKRTAKGETAVQLTEAKGLKNIVEILQQPTIFENLYPLSKLIIEFIDFTSLCKNHNIFEHDIFLNYRVATEGSPHPNTSVCFLLLIMKAAANYIG